MEYPRWQKTVIEKMVQERRVLVVAGPRQCGKTTLVRKLLGQKGIYRTLDDTTLLQSALNDPHGFVNHGDDLMVIDEIQRAPLLLQAIKMDVDINIKAGRFLLTGSANIQSLPSVTESLAGRVHKVRLRPLSQGELHKSAPRFLDNAFNEHFPTITRPLTKREYLEKALVGGFPEAIALKNPSAQSVWHRDYLHALLERDLKDITHIRRQDAMRKLLEILAAWSGKFIDLGAIGANLSLSSPTLESYMNALEALYLTERVHPWLETDYERASKRDKIFFTDTGLMASLLNWRMEDVELNGDLNGKLMETFVFNELSSIVDTNNQNYRLFHYRNRDKKEIDFIIKNHRGNLLGIEIKAGSAIGLSDFKNLKWFQSHATKKNSFVGIVLYTGAHTLPFGSGLWAVPIQALWTSMA